MRLCSVHRLSVVWVSSGPSRSPMLLTRPLSSCTASHMPETSPAISPPSTPRQAMSCGSGNFWGAPDHPPLVKASCTSPRVSEVRSTRFEPLLDKSCGPSPRAVARFHPLRSPGDWSTSAQMTASSTHSIQRQAKRCGRRSTGEAYHRQRSSLAWCTSGGSMRSCWRSTHRLGDPLVDASGGHH